MAARKPNILFIMADDIGWFNISCNNNGIMGYRTPNIDRIAKEGANFTDFYGQQSCTAGRAAFITGQSPIRTGLTKVGMPSATLGLKAEDPTVAQFLHARDVVAIRVGRSIVPTCDRELSDERCVSHLFRKPALQFGQGRLIDNRSDP